MGRYLFAVLVFGLMIGSGVDLLRRDAPGLAVPFLIAGVAGLLGSLAALMARRQLAIVRPAMLVAAGAVVVAGIALAPGGMDRGFVIGTAVLVALLLTAFTLLAIPKTG